MEAIQEMDNKTAPQIDAPAKSIEDVGQCIANLLLQHKFLTSDQLRYAIRVCKKLPIPRTLVSVLMELHFITLEKLREALCMNPLAVPLGALLVELGFLQQHDLMAALAIQKEKPDQKLGDILTESNLLREEILAEALSFQLGYERISPAEYMPDPELFRAAPFNWFRSKDCIPLTRRDDEIVVAFADPRDRHQIEKVEKLFGRRIVVCIAGKREIQHALNRVESTKEKRTAIAANENVIIQTVNDIINRAAETSVSDIHIEPQKTCLIRWEIPRLCRGGSKSLTFAEVCFTPSYWL
jgi:hypothetical protein